jgi:uncharacterized membrane protein
MEGKAKLLGHSVHPILIVFPLGLLATAVIFDIIHMATGTPTFALVAYWMMVAGLIGGLIAAPFGLIDWMAIPSDTRAKSVGLTHGLVMIGTVLLFAVSWYLRSELPERPTTAASVFSILGLLLALVGGWLGGELVERLGIAVHPGANPNAPSSLESESTSFHGTRPHHP